MTEREATQLLKDWGQSLELCEKKQEEINSLKALIQNNSYIGSPKNDGMPKGNTKINIVDNTAIKLVETYAELIERLTEDIKRILKKREQMNKILTKFDFDCQKLVELRYRYRASWSFITRKLHISRSKCFSIHTDILKAIQQAWTFLE